MKVLFISHTRLGDAILSSCILNELHHQHPEAIFTIVVGPVASQLFEAVPNLSKLIIFKKRRFHLHWLILWLRCLPRRWDLIIDCRSSLISYALRTQKRHWHYPHSTAQEHRVKRYSSLIGASEIKPPFTWLNATHQKQAADLLPTQGICIAIAPAANWPPKTWPASSFVTLIQKLSEKNSPFHDAYFVIIAAMHEREAIQPVINAIPPGRFIDLVGTQHLLVSAACIQQCQLFIGNDSGLTHLAASVGTKTIALFGPTDPKKYAPYGAHCTVIHAANTDSAALMNHISVDEVLRAISHHTR